MTRPTADQALVAAATVTLALGVALSLWTLGTLSSDLHRLQRRAADLRQLRELQSGWQTDAQVIQWFEQLPAHQPVPLADLLARQWPGRPATVRMREPVPAVGDWAAQRAEVKSDTIRLEDLGRFLAAAESGRPPWRLVDCDIQATDQTPGSGRVRLVLEGLQKNAPVAQPSAAR